jgi:hypothetical protein
MWDIQQGDDEGGSNRGQTDYDPERVIALKSLCLQLGIYGLPVENSKSGNHGHEEGQAEALRDHLFSRIIICGEGIRNPRNASIGRLTSTGEERRMDVTGSTQVNVQASNDLGLDCTDSQHDLEHAIKLRIDYCNLL